MISELELSARLTHFFNREATAVVTVENGLLSVVVNVDGLRSTRLLLTVESVQRALDEGMDVLNDIFEMFRDHLRPDFRRQQHWISAKTPILN